MIVGSNREQVIAGFTTLAKAFCGETDPMPAIRIPGRQAQALSV
jgi:hypothetical protein